MLTRLPTFRPAAASALWALALFVLAAPMCAAATYYVSPSGNDNNPGTQAAPFLTIQQGINNAATGDTVSLAAGTYTGPGDVDLDFGGNSIAVTSQSGAATTIIDCGGTSSANHRAFYFHTSEANAVVTGMTIKNGYEGSSNGGAVDIERGSTATLMNCIVSGNTATGYDVFYGSGAGGGVYSAGTVTLMGCTLTANTAASGGGLCNTGTATLTSNVVTNNITITNTGGDHGGEGGGVLNFSGTMTLTDCALTGNTGGSVGGAVCTFSNNNATSTLADCTLSGNTAPDGGGVSNGFSGTTTLTGCTLTGNSATSSGGGVDNEYTMTLIDCTLKANTAVTSGGGIYQGNSFGGINKSMTLTECAITENTAANGGGVYDGNSPATLTNCLLASNEATTGNGGGADNIGPQFTLQFCTLSGNSAPATGAQGGALENDGTATLTDDILYGNTASYAGEIGMATSGNPVTTLTYTDIQGGHSGTGNFHADPLFVNPAGGDFHLQPHSPALGAGISISGVTTDLDGRPRPDPPSVGAYEASPMTATSITVSSITGSAGQTVTLSATLTETGGAGLSGKTLSFSVDNTAVGTAVTNSSGVAMLSYTIPAGDATGSHTITVSFAGDSGDAASSGTGTLTVTAASKLNTVVTVGARSGKAGTTVALKAYLKTSGGVALSGKTLTYTVNGVAAGSAVTDSTGLATLNYAIPANAPAGSEPVVVSFAGDSGDNASTGNGTLTVTGSALSTSITVAAVSGAPGQTVSLSATLKAGTTLLSGKTLTFKVDSTTVGTAVTNSSGVATLSYAIPAGDAPGSHTVTVSFAGDSGDSASSGIGTLTVTGGSKLNTVVTVGARSGKAGTTVSLKAYLKTTGGAALVGKTLTYTVNGVAAGSAVTDSTGLATLNYAIPANAPAGNEPIVVSFAGDASDNASSGKGTLTVS